MKSWPTPLTQLGDLPWQLLVIGDGPARPEVEQLLAPLETPDGPRRLHFAGEATQETLAWQLAATDLFLWPAINEAYGMAFLEAQAAGLPVVAGRSGGVPNIVAEGDSGLLTPAGDPEAFAAAARSLISDPARRQTMAALARARVATNHSLESATGQLDAYLQEARRRGPQPPSKLDEENERAAESLDPALTGEA